MKKRQRRARGFTLVELMVSLVAGLIVTIAVVGLARAATTTFFEAARMASTESSIRTASERLRQDLARAAYMSTGNIKLARDGQTGVPLSHKIAVVDPSSSPSGARYTSLQDLQGVQITVGGSGNYPIGPEAGSAGPNNLSTNNGLNPDSIIIGGNFTTDDSYQGTFFTAGAGGQTVELNSAADAAVRRLLNTADPLASLQAAFQPVAGRAFAVRVVDARGCQHYAVVASLAYSAGKATITLAPDSTGGTALVDGGHGTCGAKDSEPVTINPVQRVRWFIGPNTDATLAPASGTEVAGNKFNLYRDFLDAADPPQPVLAMRQVVAEYATDLKFGITVADAANLLQIYEMDSEGGGGTGNIEKYTQTASTTTPGSPGPQRVRSVRFRIATRTSLSERRQNLVVAPAPYITRYCVEAAPAASCTSFARVRTVVSEVALINQLGMTY
ncbi:MAG: hypothetical protein JWP97_16 [Labilithrix sp.]|nr:hypothetical protein [Labilithrix sp.]